MLAPYSYRKGADTKLATFYYFDTEDLDKYTVRFFHLGEIQSKKKLQDCYSVAFMTSGRDRDTKVVNKGRFYRIMATLVCVIGEFMEEKSPYKLQIDPVKNFKKDRRRYRIYKYYIKKYLPKNYKLKTYFFNHNFTLKRPKVLKNVKN